MSPDDQGNSGPLVSVIVPAYNYGSMLPETLESVARQAWLHWECIIIDDGSTDDTAQVGAQFASRDKRFRYHYQDNAGLSAARNSGLRLARGSLVQLLDADDLILPGKLLEQVHFLNSNPDVDIVFGSANRFRLEDVAGHPSPEWGQPIGWQPKISEYDDPVMVLLRVPPPPHAPLTRRRVFDVVGDFDTSMRACEDWHFWMRCAIAGMKFRYVDSPATVALYRAHNRSMVADAALMDKWIRRLRERLDPLLKTNENAKRLNKRLWEGFEGTAAIRAAQSGDRVAAARACVRGFKLAEGARQKAKWLYCSVAALTVSGEKFEPIFYSPIFGQDKR